MGVEIPLGYAQCVYRFSLSGDPEEMVATLGLDVTAETDPMSQVALDAASQFATQFPAATIAIGYTFVGVTLYVGDGMGGSAVYENIQNIVGTFNSPTLPQNVAFLVKKNTAAAGRRGKGRMYLPPALAGESVIDGLGIIGSSSVTAINTKLAAILSSHSSLNHPAVLLHDVLPAPLTPTPITSLILDSKVASMRRRLRR